jgi:hypothetical protein
MLNLVAFEKHGTVEFRLHQGTLNGAKIERWTRLCVRLVEIAASGTWSGEARDLELLEALREVFRVRSWALAGAPNVAPVAASLVILPAFSPRPGSKRAALWALFDANPTMGVAEIADLAESAGHLRKYATDQHWHWRRARAVAAPVAAAPVTIATRTDDEGEMADNVSYFTERAQELSA